MDRIETTVLRGAAILPHLDALAQLRIQVFREWPYLYEGTVAYERSYLNAYAQCPDSVVVIAQSGERIVGASTALPLAAAAVEFRQPFVGGRYAAAEVFYFGESVLLPDYRGHGCGHRFFDERESAARAYGARYAAFCAVDRRPEDTRRPAGYRELGNFWAKRGYLRQSALQAIFSWREPDEAAERRHTLTFWIKAL
jgi:GNAT superfamily N-acetyltransferase